MLSPACCTEAHAQSRPQHHHKPSPCHQHQRVRGLPQAPGVGSLIQLKGQGHLLCHLLQVFSGAFSDRATGRTGRLPHNSHTHCSGSIVQKVPPVCVPVEGTGLVGSIRWDLWAPVQQLAVHINIIRTICKAEGLEGEPQSLRDLSGQEVEMGILAIQQAPMMPEETAVHRTCFQILAAAGYTLIHIQQMADGNCCIQQISRGARSPGKGCWHWWSLELPAQPQPGL